MDRWIVCNVKVDQYITNAHRTVMECVPIFVIEVTFVELADEVPEARLQPHQTTRSVGTPRVSGPQVAFVGADGVRKENTGIVEAGHLVCDRELSDCAPKAHRAVLPYYRGVFHSSFHIPTISSISNKFRRVQFLKNHFLFIQFRTKIP